MFSWTQRVPLLVVSAALTMGVSIGCTTDDDGFEDSYENHIMLTCNGNVLVDETFTSLESCESFRDANSFMCSGIELSVNC